MSPERMMAMLSILYFDFVKIKVVVFCLLVGIVTAKDGVLLVMVDSIYLKCGHVLILLQ